MRSSTTNSPLHPNLSGELARLRKMARGQPVSEDLSTRADNLGARLLAEVGAGGHEEENSLLSLLLDDTVHLLGQLSAGGVQSRKPRARHPRPRTSVPILGREKSRTTGAETTSSTPDSRSRQPAGNRGPASIPPSLLVARKHCGKCWVTHMPFPRYLS